MKEEADDSRFPGWRKYYNSYTIRGRANASKFWLSVYFLSYLVWKLKKKPPAPIPHIHEEESKLNTLPRTIVPQEQSQHAAQLFSDFKKLSVKSKDE
ncbi:hypothetical protein O3M35_011904 [Rhynocoris fuscipes]|uniref:Uncharacterized protein n=1 Tax=Rhynocoris fuscipes TaxID=488301 RepID=A0AAW1D426_9HEMI